MFKPGREKTGGRVTGVPNRRTLALVPLVDQLKALNFDIATEVVRLFPQLDPRDQAALLVKLCDYVFPKKQITDITVAEAQKVLEDDLAAQGFDVGTAINSTTECAEGKIVGGDL